MSSIQLNLHGAQMNISDGLVCLIYVPQKVTERSNIRSTLNFSDNHCTYNPTVLCKNAKYRET